MMPSYSQQPSMDAGRYQETMLNVIYNVTTIISAPVEMGLRLRYGSTYFPPMLTIFTMGTMILLPFIAGNTIPFIRLPAPMGLYGLGTLSKLYFLGAFLHGLRVWHLMLHMHLEEYSCYEGPPLPFFRVLPGGFWAIRIAYEPLLVFFLVAALMNFFILQPAAAHFLEISAIALALKQYAAWYIQWLYIRRLLDAKYIGLIIAQLIDNKASQDDLAKAHIASFPKDVPDDIRRSSARHMAQTYSPETTERPKTNDTETP